ncbi:uncharacterized protein LOC132555002 [Ylistrum balloti]|uniref:uncharacterized protein LOC132555002 n=1 Tax=Ylistrum balloti TaxID=509963 RepID=UPI002905E97C|nr:uncharacterized protein LOC132555002 [Ylistrum balloti]
MAKECMDDVSFNRLLSDINQQTSSLDKKVETLYSSRGFFSADQAATLLYAYGSPSDKIKAVRVLEPRLCRMTCKDARGIIGAVSVHNDKLIVLDCIKRCLCDYQTTLGQEYILSAFPFEHDKQRAMQILQTVGSSVASKVAAGGHQGYAALGGLYTQARPMVPHLYGPLPMQAELIPGYGKIEIPPEAQPGVVPSVYTGHPSYAYPPDKSYAEDRGYPGNSSFSNGPATHNYPAGAPPLGHHSGAPYSTGFPQLEA